MSTSSGTQMVQELTGNPEFLSNAHTLEEVLMISGRNETEPFCSSFGPIQGMFAALITAYSESGVLQAAWISEPMFGSHKAAVEHAEDLCGPEIWPIIGGYCEW